MHRASCMSPFRVSLLILLSFLSTTGTCSARYDPTWESLDSRALPQWFDDAKFGLFINWGLYSVPAFAKVGVYAEWYWWTLLNPADDGGETAAFHQRVYGADFRFQDFASLWRAELFNATQWAELFVRSGARYIVPSSKHHDGFTMWPSQQAWNWNAVDIGPHRDLLGETLAAGRAAGLRSGIYFSLFEWYHPLYLTNVSAYVQQVLRPQWTDLITAYKPDLLWCDGDWEQPSDTWQSREFLAYLYNDSPVRDSVVVNDRFGSDTRGRHGGFYTAEYSSQVWDGRKWEENSGIDINSYGLNRQTPAEDYFTSAYLINLLLRSVSNGGNLLLNIGPRSDGTIPTIMQQRLLDIGDWLSVNGEGVYGSRVHSVRQEGSIDNTTVRYTRSSQAVYAFILDWPEDWHVTLKAVNGSVGGRVEMLGLTGKQLEWRSATVGIEVQLPLLTPGRLPCQHVWTLKLLNFGHQLSAMM